MATEISSPVSARLTALISPDSGTSCRAPASPRRTSLCALKSEGWSYAYSRSVDWEKEETCWIVEMARNGVHYSVGRPSFEEAVRAACDFIKDNFEKSKDRFYQ